MGCKFMLMNQGGKPHSDECRKRVMRWMALSDNSMYRDRLEHWTSKVQHYFDVCGDAFNNVTLTDFSEPKNVAHPEPTSPAVHLPPDPEKTPKVGEEATRDPAEESNVSANLKVKKRVIKFKEGSKAMWRENRARRLSVQDSHVAVETSDPGPGGNAQSHPP